ncbi:hypothetical protein Tco_0111490 [Tanacetum coccineum]
MVPVAALREYPASILHGVSSKTQALWKPRCLLECSLPPKETLLHLLRRHCSLPPKETLDNTPYLMCRHNSIVIASGLEVIFVTPATLADCSNMEWFCLKNVKS